MSTRRERAARRRKFAYDRIGALRPKCPRCGEAGPHFVPPCFGDPGFYSCDPNGMANALAEQEANGTARVEHRPEDLVDP